VPLNGAPDAAPFARVTLSFDAFAPSLVRTILTSGAERGVILGEFECVFASLGVDGAVLMPNIGRGWRPS
jgi:hypothetical protein